MTGVIPRVNKDEGFFDDADRETLRLMGNEIAKGTLENLYDEQFNIYKVFTAPSEKLFLSYSSSTSDGGALRVSMLINKVKKIFPKIKEQSNIIEQKSEIINENASFEELLKNIKKVQNNEKIDSVWEEVFNWYATNDKWKENLNYALKGINNKNKAEIISRENIENLYGKILKTSISKLEQYKQCPFSFYLTYGLNLKEQDEFKIKSLDTGSFMHDVVATFFIQEPNIKEITEPEIEKKVADIINEKLQLSKNFIFNSSPKFIVLTNILKSTISESIKYIVEQMKNSNFEILGNEVEFSKQVDNTEITGKIDRIDVGKNEDGEYIRIIDYKSSSKDINLNEVVAGTQIQLLTYMDIYSNKQNKIPAGVFYFNLIQPIILNDKKLSDEQIEQEIRKKFRMNGLILADIKVVKMMDTTLKEGTNSIIIPATINKEGILAKKSNIITREDFANLQKKIRKLIIQISKEITSGNIEIKPTYYTNKKTSACEYCKYKLICGFDKNMDTYKFIENKSNEEILKEIKEEI